MHSEIATAAAKYMAAHNWMRDGVAWEQVASVIDCELIAHPSHAMRAMAERLADLRCPHCYERIGTTIEIR